MKLNLKHKKYRSWFTKPHPPLFRLKLVYSYVIEVADSEYQLLLQVAPQTSSFGDRAISSNKSDIHFPI